MNDFNVEAPPIVKGGNLLSAYFTNQLSGLVNGVGGVAYGANVPRWVYGASVNINKDKNIYALSHQYGTLKCVFSFGNTDMTIKVWLLKDDAVGAAGVQVYSHNHKASGPVTVTINLDSNPGGFSVEYGEIYFVRVQFSKITANGDMGYIHNIYETQSNALAKPTLDNITGSTQINDVYLNSLVSAARTLKNFVKPQAIPFVGIATTASAARDFTFLRWNMRHINRYLHVSFKAADSGGGADGINLYLNNQKLKGWSNNGSWRTEIFDLQLLPNGILEPTFGVEYELKFDLEIDSGQFRALYMWELPYL